jgi:hypothetical protein
VVKNVSAVDWCLVAARRTRSVPRKAAPAWRRHRGSRAATTSIAGAEASQLMMHAVTQPNALPPQFLGKARPSTESDQPRICNMEAAKRTPIGAFAVDQDIDASAIVPGNGMVASMLWRRAGAAECFPVGRSI